VTLRRALAALALAIVSSAVLRAESPDPPKQHGVSWVAGRDAVTARDFDRLIENGVSWIAQNPFGWQRGLDTPEVRVASQGGWWGERDAGIRTTTALARARGIRTLLRPHVWLTGVPAGTWLGDVAMKSEDDWQRWFLSYETFILHYARLAEDLGIEVLSVGAELRLATTTHEVDWRRVIARVREVYHGRLTYAANWHAEFEQIGFWDALDFIGIQAYFPLRDEPTPSVAALEAAWRPHLAAIERVARRVGKPVVFTEIGYRSVPGATARPWEWPTSSGAPATEGGLRVQADAYEAFFRTFWRRDWFAGAYVWKWFPGLELKPGVVTSEFSPQNKPAERVLARWYRTPA
jgi:hypothetical protein